MWRKQYVKIYIIYILLFTIYHSLLIYSLQLHLLSYKILYLHCYSQMFSIHYSSVIYDDKHIKSVRLFTITNERIKNNHSYNTLLTSNPVNNFISFLTGTTIASSLFSYDDIPVLLIIKVTLIGLCTLIPVYTH